MNGEVRDIVGGLLLLAIGVFGALQALNFGFGTPRNMGPGFFPMIISSSLILFGSIITLVGLKAKRSELPKVHIRSLVTIVGSVILFGLLLRPFGLIVALFGVVVMSSFADPQSHPLQTALLAAAAAVGGWLLFVVIMGLNFPVLNWPF